MPKFLIIIIIVLSPCTDRFKNPKIILAKLPLILFTLNIRLRDYQNKRFLPRPTTSTIMHFVIISLTYNYLINMIYLNFCTTLQFTVTLLYRFAKPKTQNNFQCQSDVCIVLVTKINQVECWDQ